MIMATHKPQRYWRIAEFLQRQATPKAPEDANPLTDIDWRGPILANHPFTGIPHDADIIDVDSHLYEADASMNHAHEPASATTQTESSDTHNTETHQDSPDALRARIAVLENEKRILKQAAAILIDSDA